MEAKTVLDKQTIAQETQSKAAGDNLTSKLLRDVIIQPQSDLPSPPPRKSVLKSSNVQEQAREILSLTSDVSGYAIFAQNHHPPRDSRLN